ncbi:uncharacterized protein METZ01_LOCUS479708 [marine metagenome]|uniref:Uncharacterized protein n=1 Tax=marine metagenome TaxID=408172 RepID=A0A383C3U7_9ZZZZ
MHCGVTPETRLAKRGIDLDRPGAGD